jgi:hypothetical protein
MSDDLPFASRGGAVIRHYFALDGEYVLKINLERSYAENSVIGVESREQIDVRLNGERIKLFTVGGECVDSKEPRCQRFRPNVDAQFGVRVLPSEYEMTTDNDLEVRFSAKAGPATLGVAFLKKGAPAAEGGGPTRIPRVTSEFTAGSVGEAQMNLASLRLEGPLGATGAGDTPSRRRILICRPAASAEEEACARKILGALARRAYRRPVIDRDIQTLLPFYHTGRSKGGFEAGIQAALEGLLMSPNFLLRVIEDPANVAAGANYKISDLELASRLSFFLWSSVPDDELLDVAAGGKLRDPAVLERQIRRMLLSDRSTALITNFANQWLHLRDLKNVVPDPSAFPDFD